MPKRYLRIAAIVLCVALLYGCAFEPFAKENQFAVLGKIEPSSQKPYYDLLLKLNDVYPKSQAILTATVENQSDGCLLVEVTRVYKGIDRIYSSFYIKNTTSLSFADGEEYLLFLSTPEKREDEHVIHYDILDGQSDPNVIREDVVYPQNGSSVSLYAIGEEVSKLRTTVTVPAYFQYYRDLAKLIAGSDLIFIGTVEELLTAQPFPFYVRDEGFEEMFTESAQPVRITPQKMIKGSLTGPLTALRSQRMVYNTINEATLAPTYYTESDIPPLEPGGEYLFFLVGKSDSADTAYYFMVNPFQGYVQIVDDQLVPIPNNAVFSYAEYLDDSISEIEDIASGESITVHYPPFSIDSSTVEN